MFRRLSKISVIEIFVLGVVIFSTIFVVKYFGVKPEYRTIRIEVIKKGWTENYDPYGYRAPFWLSDKLKSGQVEKDINTGKTIGTIVKMESYERSGEESDIYLYLDALVTHNSRNGKYFYKDNSIDVGSNIELNINNSLVLGQITDNNVPKEGYPTKYFKVTASGKNVYPRIYNQTTVGQTMKNRATDENVVEITNITINPPAHQPIVLEKSRLLIDNTPTKDIILSLKIKAYQVDGRWYFGGHQNIKVGSEIYIFTDQVSLFPLIIESVDESTS